jgi:hypothetical protein
MFSDTATRVDFIANTMARSLTDASEEMRARRGYKAALLAELLAELGLSNVDVGEPMELPAAPPVPPTWKRVVLTEAQNRKFGERRCQKCCKILFPMDRVVYVKDEPKMIRHESCHGTKVEGSWRIYALEDRHVRKHGPQTCLKCGLPVSLGQLVAWKVGLRGVYHEECKE